MTDGDGAPPTEVPAPDPALRRLDPLVGTWTIRGRSLGAAEDDTEGRVTIEWLPGGFVLQMRGELRVADLEVHSLELVYHDPATGAFASEVYSNLGEAPARYGWDVQGDVVTHWEVRSSFTGTFNQDGTVLTGGWRPLEGTEPTAGNSYDVVMIREPES